VQTLFLGLATRETDLGCILEQFLKLIISSYLGLWFGC